MRKRLLAMLLALVMALGLLPAAAFAEGETGDTGEVKIISEGGTMETKDDGKTVIVTFGEGAELNWAPEAPEINRLEGYHAGIKMIMPDGAKGQNDAELGQGVIVADAKYQKTDKWWNDDNINEEPKDEVGGWKEPNTIKLDGANYMEYWALVKPEYFGRYGNKEGGELYYRYRFSWDNDSSYTQTVIIVITSKAKLMKDGKQVWPVTEFKPPVSDEGIGNVYDVYADTVITAASEAGTDAKIATFDVTENEGKGVTLPVSSITKANTDGVSVAVAAKDGTVTLGSDALSQITGGEDVTITIEESEDESGETLSLEPGEEVAASYDVNIQVGETPVNWGENAKANIVLTVDKPAGVGDVTKLKVYLDDEEATEEDGASVTPNGSDKIDITVPHLTLVSVISTNASAEARLTTTDDDGNEKTEYGTLSDMVGIAKENDTITLQSDVTLTEQLEISNKTITIDGQGEYSINSNLSVDEPLTGNLSMIKMTNGANVTLQNVTLDGKDNARLIFMTSGNGKENVLTVKDGVTITRGNPQKDYIGGVNVNSGKLIMEGGEIKGNHNIAGFEGDGYLQYCCDVWIGNNAEAEINGGEIGNMFINATDSGEPVGGQVTVAKGATITNAFVEAQADHTGNVVTAAAGTISNLLIALDYMQDVPVNEIAPEKYYNDRAIAKIENPTDLTGVQGFAIPAGQTATIVGQRQGESDSEADRKSVTLTEDITIGEGATLIIPEDVIVTVKSDEGGGGGSGTIPKITNNGTIQVDGSLIAGNNENDDDHLNIMGNGVIQRGENATVDLDPDKGGFIEITLDANGGTGTPDKIERAYTINADTQVKVVGTDNLPEPTKEGYIFKGWFTDATGKTPVGNDYTLTGDTVTFYAHWEAETVSVTGVTLDKSSASVKVGETLQLTATVSPSDATDQSVTWTSSNPSVAKVENGKVTGLKGGTATITATVGGQSATCTVTVVEPKPEEKPKPGDTDTPANPGNTGNNNTGSSGGGGGGGGGTGKPSIVNSGQTPAPGGPTSTNEGVAGFQDVAPGAWYAEYVQYVAEKGLFNGVSDGRFAPDANMTRAMMWTVLARYKGANTNSGSGVWYAAAQAWAIENGISDGTMADANVTREQFVTMLWRLSGEPAVSNSASFTDGGRISDYAKTAVAWAVAEGIVNGYSDGSFKPQGNATRAEVAKMLTVFCENAENAPAETAPEETAPEETTPEETTPTEATPDDEK